MRYGSLFAGIEAASQAWHSLGWKPLFFADIDKFPSAVLEHHYPEVPNVGNVEEVDWSEYKGKIDVIVGGSPCQSFSVAGKRLGMDDPRGNLALEYLRSVKEIQPSWFVFENVPGLLSSAGGQDFGEFLGEVAQLGYGFAWRVLDAQHFGVPQRRRRLFVVGHIGGDWRSAAAVLFESESLQWHTKESTEEGQSLADFITGSTSSKSESVPGGGVKTPQENWDGTQKTGTLTTRSLDQSMPDKSNFMGIVERDLHEPDNIFESSKSRRDLSPPLDARDQGSTGKPVLTEKVIPIHDKATRYKGGGDTRNNDGAGNGLGIGKDGDPMPTLDTASNHAVAQAFDSYNLETGKINQTVKSPKGGTLESVGGVIEGQTTSYRKSRRAQSTEDNETWVEDDVSNTLNTFDVGDARTTQIIQEPIAFEQNQRSEIRDLGTKSTSLKAQPGTNQQTFIARGEQTPLHGNEVSPTLDASYGKGPGERAGIERQIIGEVIGFSHTQGLDAQPSTDHFPTLRAEGQGHAIGFDWKNTGQTNYSEVNTGAPLTAEGGLAVGIEEDQEVYDARGGGDGKTANTIASGRNAAGVSDFTTLAVERQQVYENHPSDGRINEVDTSPTITAKAGTGGGNLPLVKEAKVAPTLTARDMYDGRASHLVKVAGVVSKGGSHWDDEDNPHPPLTQSHNTGGIGASNQEIFSQRGSGLVETEVSGVVSKGNGEAWETKERHMSLSASGGGQAGQGYPAVRQQMAVRRLTPLECERLQGFPDNYTKIPYRGKPAEKCPDGPRYKALGNSMAVPVMRWIGEGIQQVDDILKTLEERPEPQEIVQKSIFDF